MNVRPTIIVHTAAVLCVSAAAGLAPTANGQVIVDWVAQTAGVALAVDSADNVYTANGVYNPGGDIFVTKRDINGDFVWEATYNQTDSTKWEYPTWMAADSEDNVLVCGRRMSGYSNPVNAASILMKFSPGGELLWRNVYESDFDGSTTKRCLVDGNDNIYVLGIGSGPPGYVTKVKKFAPDGSTVWTYYNAAGIGAPLNFKLTPDGHILIIGRGITGSLNGFAKINLDGQEIWSIAGVYSLTIGDAAGDAFGNTYLVNGKYVVNPTESLIRKVDPTGMQIWEKEYTITGLRIEVGNDQRPVISGMPNSGSFGAAFLKADEEGTLLWSNLDADGPSYGLMLHAQMLMDHENSAYLAAGTLFEMAVCKVYNDGTSAWTQTLPGSYASAMAFNEDESALYVVGGTTARLLNDLQQVVGDIDGDGFVNATDLGLLLGAWDGADRASDLDGDGVVGAADLGLLLGAWTG